MQNLYENTRYISNVTRKSIIIHTQGGEGTENKAYDLQEPLTIDAFSDVYIDSFISSVGTNTGASSEVFLLGVDEFNIRKVVNSAAFFTSAISYIQPVGNRFAAVSNSLKDDDRVTLSSSEALPGDLSENTSYFITKKEGDIFQLSTTLGGSPHLFRPGHVGGAIEILISATSASGNYSDKIIIPNTSGTAQTRVIAGQTGATITHRATKFNYVGTINPCKLTKLTVSLTKNDSSALVSGDYWITFVIVAKK